MTKDEALKLALEHFETWSHEDSIFAGEFDKEITAIKEALAQPEQEPVAWIYEFYADMGHKGLAFEEQHSAYNTPLYTTPPQRNPLTRKEVLAIIDKHPAEKKTSLPMFYRDQVLDIARAIEAAHGIKENT